MDQDTERSNSFVIKTIISEAGGGWTWFDRLVRVSASRQGRRQRAKSLDMNVMDTVAGSASFFLVVLVAFSSLQGSIMRMNADAVPGHHHPARSRHKV